MVANQDWTASTPAVAVPATPETVRCSRRRRRRRGDVVASTLALAVLLAACSGSDDVSKDQPPSATSAPTWQTTISPGPSTADCPNYEGGLCLGKLDAGTYSTSEFKPKLTYTVPAGWANYEDLRGQFLLVPPRGTLKGVTQTPVTSSVWLSASSPPKCATNTPRKSAPPQV